MTWLINVVWYLPAAAIAFAVFYLVWWLGLRVFHVRQRWARLVSVPVFFGIIFIFWSYVTRSTAVYAEAFGFPVSADVRVLQSDRFLVGQSGRLYLRFHAAPTTVERIVARGLVAVDTNHLRSISVDDAEAPPWWRLQDLGATVELYQSTVTNKNSYDKIVEHLAYDRLAGLVLFKRLDID